MQGGTIGKGMLTGMLALVVGAAMLPAGGAPAAPQVADAAQAEYEPGAVLVSFRREASFAHRLAAIDRAGLLHDATVVSPHFAKLKVGPRAAAIGIDVPLPAGRLPLELGQIDRVTAAVDR